MRIDLNVVVRGANGRALRTAARDANGARVTTDLTIRDVILSGLLTPAAGDTSEAQFRRYQLAQRVKASAGSAEMTPQEVALVRRLASSYPASASSPVLDRNRS